MDRKLLAGGAATLLVMGSLGYVWFSRPSADPQGEDNGAIAKPGTLSAEQLARLGIEVAPAQATDAVPLGTVPAQVTLPPAARVAVTAPFAGVAVRILVLQGEQVSQGQPLAVIRAAEPVQFGAELARARADLELDRAKAERLALLAREGVVAGARADEARAALARTQATVAENSRLLSLAGAGTDGVATLRAPISGRVASVMAETGGPVGGSNAPFVIENTAALTLDLQLPERLAGRVAPGMTVTVTPPDGPETTGRILSVSASLDPLSRSLSAKASLAGAAGLVPGQSVSAVIANTTGQGARGVSIPAAAVARMGDQNYVFVRQDESKGARFVRRKVTTVAEAGGRAVLSAGLKPGEMVAVSGVAELKSILAGN